MADPRPAGEHGTESIRAEANRRDRSLGRTLTSIRLPAEVHERLREAADDRDLSISFLVNKAVEEFLERLIPADELRLTRDRNSEPPQVQPAKSGNEE